MLTRQPKVIEPGPPVTATTAPRFRFRQPAAPPLSQERKGLRTTTTFSQLHQLEPLQRQSQARTLAPSLRPFYEFPVRGLIVTTILPLSPLRAETASVATVMVRTLELLQITMVRRIWSRLAMVVAALVLGLGMVSHPRTEVGEPSLELLVEGSYLHLLGRINHTRVECQASKILKSSNRLVEEHLGKQSFHFAVLSACCTRLEFRVATDVNILSIPFFFGNY